MRLRSVACPLIAVLSAIASGWAAPKWTILVYGHGDHNLSPQLVVDMLEMQRAGSSDDFRIVVQTDFQRRNSRTYAEGLPAEFGAEGTRWLMTKTSAPRIESQVLERLPELDSDRPGRLADFLAWGIQQYPADRYGVILWDHGAAWRGFGGDEQDGERSGPSVMRVAGVAAALRSGMAGRIDKLDFLAFDACLMAAVEPLAILHPFAQLYVGNAEIDYGNGLDYEAMLNWLKANPAASMQAFAQAEAATYRPHHTELMDRLFMAHVAYDGAAAPDFLRSVRALAAQLRRNFSSHVARARRDAPKFTMDDLEHGDTDEWSLIDVPRFADLVSRNGRIPLVTRRAARRVVAAAERMIVARVMGEEKRAAFGVNIYFPLAGTNVGDFSLYRRLSAGSEVSWARVIIAARNAARTRRFTPSIAVGGPIIASPGQVIPIPVQVTRGRPYQIEGWLSAPGSRLSLGLAGRVTVADTSGLHRIRWDARAVTVSTREGETILPTTEQGDTGALLAPVQYQIEGNRAAIRGVLIYTLRNGRLGFAEATGASGDSAPDDFQPPPDSVVTPLLGEIMGSAATTTSKNRFAFREAKEARVKPLPPGSYDLHLVAEDVFGNRSRPVIQRVSLQ